MITLKISESAAKELIPVYEAKLKEIQDVLDQLKGVALTTVTSTIEKTVSQTRRVGDTVERIAKLPGNHTWRTLAVEALGKLKKYSTTGEIYDYLESEYKEMGDIDRRNAVSAISSVLGTLSKTGGVVKRGDDRSKTIYWGLPTFP